MCTKVLLLAVHSNLYFDSYCQSIIIVDTKIATI